MTLSTLSSYPLSDLPPAQVINASASRPLLVIADHAGQALPEEVAQETHALGLPREAFDLHIAWDIGVGGVVRGVAARLGVTAVVATYTRMLIDLNRPLGDPECVPRSQDGIAIPGNQDLNDARIEARARAFYWPYHNAIDRELGRLRRVGPVPLLFSIHSMTPVLRTGGSPRPWHASVLSNHDSRLADLLFRALKAQGLVVGFNEPYSGISMGYCVKRHGLSQGLPHATLEIRQDLIGTEAGQARWADRLAGILEPLLSDPALHCLEHY
jgi:predicted N-formylglutamate amidohydrolase